MTAVTLGLVGVAVGGCGSSTTSGSPAEFGTTTVAIGSQDTAALQAAGSFVAKDDVEVLWGNPVAQVGKSYSTEVPGVLTFRGNESRTFYGTGPIGSAAKVSWRYPKTAMCGKSSEYGEMRMWCGTGWAGQPVVFEREGSTWVAFGAYDYSFHFLDADTGKAVLPPLKTGDIAKGMLSVDPDGYPILYGGSRDNLYRAIAIDGEKPRVLWELDARSFAERKWNNDWDSAALILDGHLILTGENGRVHVVRLNRSYGDDGRVRVDPQVVWSAKSWDDELLRALGDERVSIESSPTVVGDIVYFANSGGLLQGWDIGPLRENREPRRVFRLWLGDDTDASVIADEQGYLYAAVEVDRGTKRGRELGQLLKIDPNRPAENSVVWSVDVNRGPDSGSWATPAVWGETIIFTTKKGEVLGVNRATGKVAWKLRVAGYTLSSPSVVDDTLIQGDGAGRLRAWRLNGTTAPSELWTVKLGGNIESTPAIWKGMLYVGSRDGYFYKIETTR
jgi:outer membrane protein assembly factor BamB